LQLGELAVPDPAPGEVRVRVHRSAVNPSDTKNRSGARGNIQMPFPRVIPHQDGAGVIDAVGDGVSSARVGERVWVYEATLGRPGGTAAQFTTVPARKAVRLFADGSVAGRNVLITGGAGAVGYYAVQMARLGGAAQVIATVSRPAQAERALEAGAHHVINYRSEDVAARVAQLLGGTQCLDRVVDVAFGANLAASLAMLKPGGVIASYASDAMPEPTIPFWPMLSKDLTVRFVLVYAMSAQAHDEAADFITKALAADQLRHQFYRIYSLDEIVQAHQACEAMSNVGKVLIRLD
jgi:NADPH2:quinone reductase